MGYHTKIVNNTSRNLIYCYKTEKRCGEDKLLISNKKYKKDEIEGLIFNIERYAVHDGPGIRTLVFLKGCPLRCLWCDNPEGQEPYPQLLFNSNKCGVCGECLKVCPTHATYLSKNGKIKINRKVCANSRECIKVCLYAARVIAGEYMTVKVVIDEVLKDSVFYQNSGGGVTLGGGEVTMQAEFARETLKVCKENNINTAIETCGYSKWENLYKVLEFTDLVLYDIKSMNPQIHKKYTGVSNKLILENVKKIAEIKIPIIIRVPVIPGVNSSESHIRMIIEFVKDSIKTVQKIHFLPYHELGIAKFERLGRKYEFGHREPPKDNYMQKLVILANSYGIQAQIGG